MVRTSNAKALITGLSVVVLWGCGSSSPTNPNTDNLAVEAGLQIVNIHGAGVSSDPDFPACTPFGSPYAGTGISTSLRLAKEGSAWVARSLSSDQGSFALTFRATGVTDIFGSYVAGTASGFQIDTGYPSTVAHGLRMFIDGTASVTGAFATQSFVMGRMTGAFRFVDAQGNTGNCNAVYWDMQPAR